MQRYVKLFEEFSALEETNRPSNYSWQDVRNTIQSKKSYVIIDFDHLAAMDDCITKELADENYIKQTYHLKHDERGAHKYPSVLIFAEDSDIIERVLDLSKRFDILRIITSKHGNEFPDLNIKLDNPGKLEKMEIGSNLYSTINIDDIGLDDFYSMDGNYFKFIS